MCHQKKKRFLFSATVDGDVDMKYHYGITIREYREKLNMTQSELAENCPPV